MNLYKRIFGEHKRDRLPKLMKGYKKDYEGADIDERDIELALMSGRFRDPDHVRKAWLIFEAVDINDLLAKLPARTPLNWRRRIRLWLYSIECSEPTDPWRKDFKNVYAGAARRFFQ